MIELVRHSGHFHQFVLGGPCRAADMPARAVCVQRRAERLQHRQQLFAAVFRVDDQQVPNGCGPQHARLAGRRQRQADRVTGNLRQVEVLVRMVLASTQRQSGPPNPTQGQRPLAARWAGRLGHPLIGISKGLRGAIAVEGGFFADRAIPTRTASAACRTSDDSYCCQTTRPAARANVICGCPTICWNTANRSGALGPPQSGPSPGRQDPQGKLLPPHRMLPVAVQPLAFADLHHFATLRAVRPVAEDRHRLLAELHHEVREHHMNLLPSSARRSIVQSAPQAPFYTVSIQLADSIAPSG